MIPPLKRGIKARKKKKGSHDSVVFSTRFSGNVHICLVKYLNGYDTSLEQGVERV